MRQCCDNLSLSLSLSLSFLFLSLSLFLSVCLSLQCNCRPSDSIAVIKDRCVQLKFVPDRNVRLRWGLTDLSDEWECLGSYGVTKDATLVFLGRLRGGAKEEDQAAKAEAKPADERKPAETSPALPAPTADVKEPGVAATSVAAANQVAQRHAKLCMDASGLIRKGVFGGIALFDGTLEDQVGHMDASALRAIYAEHVLSADAKTAFSPPNNPTLECTPEGELFYVVGTDGIDTEKCELKPDTCPAHYEGCMVQGRNDTPLSKLLVAEEVKRAGLRDTEVIALRLYSGNFLHATAS